MSQLEVAKSLFLDGLDRLMSDDYAGAEHKLRAAHRLAPDRVSVLTNLSAALLKQGKIAEAKTYAERSVELDASNAAGWLNLASCVGKQGGLMSALALYDKVLTLEPDYPEAWLSRGAVLHDLARSDEALACYDRALALKPDYADAWSNRGIVLKDRKRYDEALACYEKAIALKPNSAEAWTNRGVALKDLKRYDEALAAYDKASALNDHIPYVPGDRLLTRLLLCDWDGLDSACEGLARRIEAGDKVANPHAVLALPLSPAQQRQCAEIYTQHKFPASANLPPIKRRYAHERIRLGYFSADFHNHATTHLIAGLFELHDRSRFEVNAFSYGPPSQDTMRRRLEGAFDRFLDVHDRTDEEITALARDNEIDIAIDLKGYTQDARTRVFAMRAAPVQVNYLGYPGTMGAAYMDYLIADATLVPPADIEHYAEKVVYLPHTYQVNDSSRLISEESLRRAEAGLPAEGLVFCCFNNAYKITPDVFDIWMRLLQRIDGSVLWLLADNAAAARNLRKEAEARNISGDRLVFAERLEPADHLARHRLADLFLDTFYCNAHTTASDALWAGLPVVTHLGRTFAGRVAASLLHAIGLPELITHSADEYQALAAALAEDRPRLADIRQRLAQNRKTYPLFDTGLFAKHIEAGYRAMWERHEAGLPPDRLDLRGDS